MLSDGILFLCIINLVDKGRMPLFCLHALPPAFLLILNVLRFRVIVSVHVFVPFLLVLNICCATTERLWTGYSFLHVKRSGTYTNHWALKGFKEYAGKSKRGINFRVNGLLNMVLA